MFPSSLKCLIHKRLVHLSLIPIPPFFHLHNVQLILQILVSLFGYTAPTGSHKFRNSLCSISHLVNGSTGVILLLLFLESLFLSSSYNQCAVSLRIPAHPAPQLHSAVHVCTDFLLNPDPSSVFSGNYFSTAGNLLALSIASLLERLSMPWHSCRVRCALNRPAILLFARVLAPYACMC